jgi:hypothetical protein
MRARHASAWRKAACGLLLAAALPLLAMSPAGAQASLEQRLEALQPDLDPRAAAVLGKIEGTERRLLAARSYLRSASVLEARWSWDAAEAESFAQSPGQAALDAAIVQVQCEFQRRNPGHSLFVNPEFRTLEKQVERWNSNESVGHAAANFAAALRTHSAPFAAPSTAQGREEFRRLVSDTRPVPTPPLAAPGLSRHGRMGAIDFQVMKGDELAAGADSRTTRSVWDESGWTARLRAAVEAAQAGFTGPLQEPYEPWHYEFTPGPATSRCMQGP